jgi:L-ascorbate metabolism protein UlaG (beta-lactamase superfamily)
MQLTWIGHSTVLVELDGLRILTDPLLRNRVAHLRRVHPVDPAATGHVDVALVSHGHYDHLDVPSLRLLDPKAPVVVPRGLGRPLRRAGRARVVEVGEGEELGFGDVTVQATPAHHPGGRQLRKSGALGFALRGSASVYFAGDTDLFDGMAELGPVDVAVLPVSGWGSKLPPGHLDPRRAAEALRLLRPRLAVPVHWGTFRTPFAPRPDDRPAVEFVRAAAELAPEVEVRVLAIGETLTLEAAR